MTHNVRRREQIDKHTKRVRKFEWRFSDFEERERERVSGMGFSNFKYTKQTLGN